MSAHRIPYGLLAAEDRMTQSRGGKAVLVVEDEIIIGMMICKEIVRAGGAAVGPVNSAAGAVKEIESRTIDAVILDAKLADGDATDLAARLAAGRTPFVVISGYEQASLPSSLKAAPFIAKPISVPILVEAIERLAIEQRQSVANRRLSHEEARQVYEAERGNDGTSQRQHDTRR
jgi:DNA-binding NtrC family response regulator